MLILSKELKKTQHYVIANVVKQSQSNIENEGDCLVPRHSGGSTRNDDSKRAFLAILLLLFFQAAGLMAQPMPDNTSSTSGDLLFPIKPGTPNTLAGTMGELRSSHFHTGIDIRTGGQEGVPVLAADDGYVFRVSVSPTGYGNALYIKHPNGHSTVYGHLQSFNKEIANYVRSQQYKKKEFALSVFPTADMFPVKRGDIIALSGNSGSSGGPHLHFDVRNRHQDLLNPLNYGFKEIIDNRAPEAKELALVTSGINSRVAGQFGRIVIPISERETYYVKDTIEAIGRIGMELYAYDRMDNTRFRTGINQIDVSVNDTPQLETTIETWPFSKARQFYTYINYEALATSGQRFHKLYIDDGNNLDFYSGTPDNGYLNVEEGKLYDVEIKLTDSYENESNVHFVIKGVSKSAIIPSMNTAIPDSSWRIEKNVLMIKGPINDTCVLYTNGERKEINPAFETGGNGIYLWDLNDGIIDSFNDENKIRTLGIKAFVPTGIDYKLYDPHVDIQFDKNSLFESIFLNVNSSLDSITGMDLLTIGNPMEPVNNEFTVNLKPTKIPADTKYWQVYILYGNAPSYIGGEWKDNYIQFGARSFGTYTLLADSIPPVVKPIILNRDELVFKISDDLSGINTFEMYVNDAWVLMDYDPKKELIWAEKPGNSYTYTGSIKLKVTDNTGNETIYSTELN